MAEEKKKSSSIKRVVKKTTVSKKPVPPLIYEDGEIQMPFVAITTKEAFFRIWKGNVKKTDLEKAWKKAERFKNRFK